MVHKYELLINIKKIASPIGEQRFFMLALKE